MLYDVINLFCQFYLFFFFFKQKTAYEITVRDWSSDVCSSDLGWGSPCSRSPDDWTRATEGSEERRVGKSVDCCVDLGGRRIIKKKKKKKTTKSSSKCTKKKQESVEGVK